MAKNKNIAAATETAILGFLKCIGSDLKGGQVATIARLSASLKFRLCKLERTCLRETPERSINISASLTRLEISCKD